MCEVSSVRLISSISWAHPDRGEHLGTFGEDDLDAFRSHPDVAIVGRIVRA